MKRQKPAPQPIANIEFDESRAAENSNEHYPRLSQVGIPFSPTRQFRPEVLQPRPAMSSSDTLRGTTHAFCRALVSQSAASDLLHNYFSNSPKITEHGPEWSRSRLPFLAKTFHGKQSCADYFRLLAEILEMHLADDAFPEASRFIVDGESGMVSVVGKGKFASKKSGKSWAEQFIYRFSEFDEAGRIGHWEVWADPLSAWEAVGE